MTFLVGCTAMVIGASGRAQEAGHSAAFVTQLGRDTVSVERFSKSGTTYSIEQVIRVPRTDLRHTHLDIGPDGNVRTLFLMHHRIDQTDAPLLASTQLTYSSGDSAAVQIKRGDSTSTRSVAAPTGMLPALSQSFLGYELASMQLRKSGADSLVVRLVYPDGGSRETIVRRIAADSMTFAVPPVMYRAQVDGEGRILHAYIVRGQSTRRVRAIDPNRIATAWLALDQRGRGMGALSPRDSATGKIGDARITIRYARPKARGRVIFGSLVPWDSAWRTGANDATVLQTDKDLMIGNAAVPAGRYSLFTIPSRTGTTLVINRETEREGEPLAGTDYDATHDLARVPMRTTSLRAPVEQLTISVLPRSSRRGLLRIAWARREMTVPIQVRP